MINLFSIYTGVTVQLFFNSSGEYFFKKDVCSLYYVLQHIIVLSSDSCLGALSGFAFH